MKNLSAWLFIAFLLTGLFSCKNRAGGPDVSAVKINITTQRYDLDFVSQAGKAQLTELEQLRKNYASFFGIYSDEILGLKGAPPDTIAQYLTLFAREFKPVFDSAAQVFRDFKPYEHELKAMLQHVRYYFPAAKLPTKVITYVGPLDGYGDILISEESTLAVGLQLHLGAGFSGYKSEQVRDVYPDYLSARFVPATISVNAARNIINEMFPFPENDRPLVQQMVEKGKRLYLLEQFLPEKDPYLLIGYSEKQYKDCIDHEAVIWDLFVKNSYLQITDKNTIRNYLDEGPKTQELGEGAPGNIGSFSGWQIVRKYMERNPKTTLQQLMQLDADQLFTATKYKP